MKKMKNKISEYFESRFFQISTVESPRKVKSPFTILRKYAAKKSKSAFPYKTKSSKDSMSKNFFDMTDYETTAKKIFSEDEIASFKTDFDLLGFDFIRNENRLGVVIKNPALYASKFSMGKTRELPLY